MTEKTRFLLFGELPCSSGSLLVPFILIQNSVRLHSHGIREERISFREEGTQKRQLLAEPRLSFLFPLAKALFVEFPKVPFLHDVYIFNFVLFYAFSTKDYLLPLTFIYTYLYQSTTLVAYVCIVCVYDSERNRMRLPLKTGLSLHSY